MAPPTFRRGEVIAKRFHVVAKSGETSLWIGYQTVDTSGHAVPEGRGTPEADTLVKIVRPELVTDSSARANVIKEMSRIRGLQHPGMPRLIDVVPFEEQSTVMCLESIQSGLSLGTLLKRVVTFRKNECYPLSEARQIGAQLASTLSHIHGQNLCHGDLRLESVLMRPDGAKLCDAGLGGSLPRAPYLDAIKRSNETDLLPPEVRAGKKPDARADVFGLASLYRYLLSLGQPAAWESFLAETPINTAIGVVLLRGLAEDPAHRYSSIEALLADIEAVAMTGAPIKKRLAQTPLAMAVAAGRLPAEELSRSVEELVPESNRSRRNSGMYEIGAVLTPIGGGPAAKMSIGTIPPAVSSGQSGRVRGADQSGEADPADPSAASAGSKGGPPSTGSKTGLPSSSSRSGVPPSTGSKGAPSASSRGRPRRSGEISRTGISQQDVVPIAPSASPIDISASSLQPITAPTPSPTAGAAPVAAPTATPSPSPSGAEPTVPPPESAARPRRDSKGPKAPASGRSPAADGESASAASKRSADGGTDSGGPKRAEGDGSTHSPSSTRSGPSGRSRNSEGSMRGVGSGLTPLPQQAVVTSRLALVGALVLAALVGALIAVLVMLLLRATPPAPGPVPNPGAPVATPQDSPAKAPPSVPSAAPSPKP